MKILLSAYACEPKKGSEPGIGWNWAIELSKIGYDVWVLTRSLYKPMIEKEYQHSQKPTNLHFIYHDLPNRPLDWEKVNRWEYLYYALWQWRAYRVAKKIHAKEKFDLVHHITWGSIRQRSLMGNLKIPFIFGPVAGGESAPWRLRFHYGLRGYLIDLIRDLTNCFVRFDPMMWKVFRQAQKIYTTSESSKKLLPSRFFHKVDIQLAIGMDHHPTNIVKKTPHKAGLRVLYVGRLIFWKGMGLGLRSFAKFLEYNPDARLTIVGDGSNKKQLHNLAQKLNIAHRIDWVPWIERSQLTEIYQNNDVFLFPSLHDSGGMVILEAMSHGLPIVCFDLGGPGIIVDNSSGIKIHSAYKTEKAVIHDMCAALVQFSDFSLLEKLSTGAIRRVSHFSWENVVNNVYRSLK